MSHQGWTIVLILTILISQFRNRSHSSDIHKFLCDISMEWTFLLLFIIIHFDCVMLSMILQMSHGFINRQLVSLMLFCLDWIDWWIILVRELMKFYCLIEIGFKIMFLWIRGFCWNKIDGLFFGGFWLMIRILVIDCFLGSFSFSFLLTLKC